MAELVVQLVGLGLLVLALGLSETWMQRRRPLQGAMRGGRMLSLMAGFGGVIGSYAWALNLPYAFAWALPPLAARFLAAAAVAFGIVALRAAWIGSAGHLRMVALMLLVYLGPLAAAVVLLHLDRFDPASPITYVFFLIVLGMIAGAGVTLIRLPYDERGMSSGVLGWIGTLAGAWGLVLFAWPAGPWPVLWPWASDPLTSRLIAAMFLTVAAACHYAEGREERLSAYILCVIYGFGISVAVILAFLNGKPGPVAYLAFWACVASISAMKIFSARGALPEPAATRRD